MGAWILIVAFAASTTVGDSGGSWRDFKRSYHVQMQEFANLPACQHASIEAQKIAPGIRVVCVPKG